MHTVFPGGLLKKTSLSCWSRSGQACPTQALTGIRQSNNSFWQLKLADPSKDLVVSQPCQKIMPKAVATAASRLSLQICKAKLQVHVQVVQANSGALQMRCLGNSWHNGSHGTCNEQSSAFHLINFSLQASLWLQSHALFHFLLQGLDFCVLVVIVSGPWHIYQFILRIVQWILQDCKEQDCLGKRHGSVPVFNKKLPAEKQTFTSVLKFMLTLWERLGCPAAGQLSPGHLGAWHWQDELLPCYWTTLSVQTWMRAKNLWAIQHGKKNALGFWRGWPSLNFWTLLGGWQTLIFELCWV